MTSLQNKEIDGVSYYLDGAGAATSADNAAVEAEGAQPAHREAMAKGFRLLISLYGLVWLANAVFDGRAWFLGPPGVTRNRILQVFAGSPQHTSGWLHSPGWLNAFLLSVKAGVADVGPHAVAGAMVAIAAVMGIALVARVALRAVSVFGLAYSLVLWLVLAGLGFPYTGGQTDPGVLPVYAMIFLFILGMLPVVDKSVRQGAFPNLVWRTARIVFGLLWLFDAALKFLPAFLFHFVDQITGAIPGEPQWMVAWLGFIVHAVNVIGPTLCAVVVGLIELAVAVSLLAGRAMKPMVPLAILYCLAVWCTAEAFGGPYTAQGTGCGGDVIGNVIMYVFPFLMLGVEIFAAGRQRRKVAEQAITTAPELTYAEEAA